MSGSSRPVGIHVGLPRTGTKTLQWQLLSRHPEIHYVGTWSRRAGRITQRPSRPYVDAEARELFKDQFMDSVSMDLARCRELWRSLESRADPDKTIVWSNEVLSWGPAHSRAVRAEMMWRLFRPCRIVFTLREPVDHLESVHRMLLRTHIVRPSERGASLEGIDTWFEDPEASPYEKVFDHAETVRGYRELFGSDAVKVLLFEQLREDPRRFFAEVSDHLGVDPEVGAGLYEDRVDNARISDRQVRLAGRLQKHPFVSRLANRLPDGFRAYVLYRIPRRATPSSASLSESNANRVRELSRASNRWFRDEFGLPMERYGYSV